MFYPVTYSHHLGLAQDFVYESFLSKAGLTSQGNIPINSCGNSIQMFPFLNSRTYVHGNGYFGENFAAKEQHKMAIPLCIHMHVQ